MIPKKIHYIWFGDKPFPPLERKCIDSWRRVLPEYEIICWDENNYDNESPVFKKSLKNKKWAFCADIARLDILNKHGGLYLDTDVEVIKPFDNFLNNSLFIGKESEKYLGCAVIGSEKEHPFIKNCLDASIESMKKDFIPLPKIMTYVYDKMLSEDNAINVYDVEYFYPYNPYAKDIKLLLFEDVTLNTHAIHHWNYSWRPSISDRVKSKLKKILNGNKYLK